MGNKRPQRLLFVEPNPCDREIIPTEDLSISVELKTITRGRSVISGNGEEGTGSISNNSDGQESKVIGFIEGSPVGNRRSLTTNYTQINTSFSTGGENDLEALGIESINIKFDTAYIPQISIKFIDVRGQSILQQGSSSKYKMFFEMPFPIFELTVKGFYGKAVTYCLHLRSWNASFNSQTGNFEIQTEFIGYTFALLTDCIIGYIRAAALTKRGQTLFNKYKTEKDEKGFKKYPGLITIDKFLNYVDKIGRDFKKLKQDSEEIKQINSITRLNSTLKKLNKSIVALNKNISEQGKNDKLNSNLSDIVLIPDNDDTDSVSDLIDRFKQDTNRDWKGFESFDGINKTIEIEELKIKTERITGDKGIKRTELLLSDFTDFEKLSNKLNNSGNGYTNKELRDKLCEKILRNFIIKPKENIKKYTLYDFSEAFKEVETRFNLAKERKKRLTTKLTNTLKTKVKEEDFTPTIKNIIDILAVHSQIFLQTIRQVSKDAEKNQERRRILIEKLGYNNMDISNDQTIYPWPEYKSEQSNKLTSLDDKETTIDTSLYETWIGSRLTEQEFSSVPEVEFVEELLENLMKIAKKDEQRVNGAFAKTPHFYPVSPIDAPIPLLSNDDDDDNVSLITHNPYYKAIVRDGLESQKTIPQEAYRCLIMRGFNGLGLANRIIGRNQIEIMGTLEADNLFNVIVSELNKVDKTKMINSISNLKLGVVKEQVDEVIKKCEDGLKNVVNPHPTHDGKLLERERLEIDGDIELFFKYTYLNGTSKSFGEDRTYIPVSGGFNCKDFISTATTLNGETNTLKSPFELKELSSSLLFVGNEVNGGFSNPTDVINIIGGTSGEKMAIGTKIRPSDGAVYLKILDDNTYQNNSVTPPYGDEPISEYLKLVGEKTLLNQSKLILTTYEDNDELDENLNRYNGLYNSLEINNIIYDSEVALPKTGFQKNFYDTRDYDLISEGLFTKDENITKSFENELAGDVISAFYYQDTSSLYFMGDSSDITNSSTEYNGTFLAEQPSEEYEKQYYEMPEDNSKIYKVFESTEDDEAREDIKPILYGKQRQLIGDINKSTKTPPIYLPYVEFSVSNTYSNDYHFSLFGNKFYYNQSNIGRAFLYLHCISWQGIHANVNFQTRTGNSGGDSFTSSMFSTFEYNKDDLNYIDGGSFQGNDDTYTIKGLFGNSGSFIKAPKLWCAFIGALIYRYDNSRVADVGLNFPVPGLFLLNKTNKDIIDFGTNILPWQDKDSHTPDTDEYLYYSKIGSTCGMSLFFDSDDFDINRDDSKTLGTGNQMSGQDAYPKVDEVILGLPTQAREEFKRVFIEFVEGDFKKIQEDYELFEDVKSMESIHSDLLTKVKETKKFGPEKHVPAKYVSYGSTSQLIPAHTHRDLLDKFKALTKQDVIDSLTLSGTSTETARITRAIENYSNISPINDEDFEDDKILGGGAKVKKYVFDLTMKEGRVSEPNRFITNLLAETYTIMNNHPSIFRANNGKNPLHPDKVVNGVTKRNKHKPVRVESAKLKLYLENFFTRFNELASDFKDPETDENDKYQKKIFNSIDDDTIKLSIYRTLSSINTKWIGGDVSNGCANIDNIASSFRYIDSSFSDIGDKFLINPSTVYNKITSNYNQSFFDVVQTILTNNNFTFIPLPSFINFRDIDDLKDAFKAYSYKESINKKIVGPSFVCVYTGQKSTNLDLGEDSEYKDDGIYIQNDGCGNITGPIPKIFKEGGNSKSLDIPYFLVSYGKDNQSFFKDIKLDQREFVETAESLEIIETISNSGNKRKPSFNGQNLFNVYQKRSYSAEIEIMGNAMIQPMMYFQLNNIPMFRGAYLINNVSHSITPHNMSTTFKGQRIKNTKIKLIDESQLFMNLLGPLEDAGVSETINDSFEESSKKVITTTNEESTDSQTQVTTNKTQTNITNSKGGNVSTNSSKSGTKINTNVKSIII